MKGYVTYAYSGLGYEVAVYDAAGTVIEEHPAGNHRLDSQQRIDDPPWMLPLRTPRRYARWIALGMAKDHPIPHERVALDPDRMKDLTEAGFLAFQQTFDNLAEVPTNAGR